MLLKGQLEEAQLENLAADPANLPEGRTWLNTTSGLIKTVVGGVIKVIAKAEDLTAANIVNTPSGNLAATDVQAALNELQSDIDTRATSASVSATYMPLAGGNFSGSIGSTNTDHWKIPVGTTLQRPGSPANGMIRFNTDLTSFEGYGNSTWAPIGGGGYTVTSVQSVTAGGTISLSLTDNRQMRHVQGNAAAVDASLTPFGSSAPKDGTEVLLVGNDDTNTVSLTYNDAAKGLVGNFTTIELGKYATIICVYSQSLDRWIVEGGR
jgi:hypothetical protein